ncbi:unnamed protein product, partial [Symbiodinium necroappetens]
MDLDDASETSADWATSYALHSRSSLQSAEKAWMYIELAWKHGAGVRRISKHVFKQDFSSLSRSDMELYCEQCCELMLREPRQDTAERLLQAAERWQGCLRSSCPIMHEEEVNDGHHDFSDREVQLLKEALKIYYGQGSMLCAEVDSMNEGALQERIISEWKRAAGPRCYFPPRRRFADEGAFRVVCQELGFVDGPSLQLTSYAYSIVPGASLSGLFDRCQVLESLCCDEAAVCIGKVVILASTRAADAVVDSHEKVEGCPCISCVDFTTESALAEELLEQLRYRHHMGPPCLEQSWRAAEVVTTQNPKAGFSETFSAWLSTVPDPGSILLICNQPYIPRYGVQARKHMKGTAFEDQQLDVVGRKMGEMYFNDRSEWLPDAIAHWASRPSGSGGGRKLSHSEGKQKALREDRISQRLARLLRRWDHAHQKLRRFESRDRKAAARLAARRKRKQAAASRAEERKRRVQQAQKRSAEKSDAKRKKAEHSCRWKWLNRK